MIRNLLIVLLLCILARSYSPMYGCFYNQKIRISNPTYFNYMLGGYDFSITWTQPQGNITKYSYTLVGYRSELGNNFICFNGSLINVTNTGAIFLFEPQNGSSIAYVVFSIVLVQTCSGYIQLQLIQYETIQMNLPAANRTSTYELVRVNLTKAITSDIYNYQTSAHLTAFHLTNAGTRMDLGIESLDVISGYTYVSVNIISRRSYGNVIPRIWFTLILVHIPSFSEQISSYTGRELYALYPTGLTPDIHNFGIPYMFNSGNLNDQCVFSLIKIYAYVSNLTHEINYQEQSMTNISNISFLISQQSQLAARYQVFCMQNCPPGTFVTVHPQQFCGTCANYSPNCEICTYINVTYTYTCQKCYPNYFLFILLNTCYNVCPVGYYGNNATYKCALCNSVCHSCADATNCIVCKIGWAVQGGCTTIQGCIKALSPVMCSICNTAGMFYLVSRTCKCVAGYFLVTHYCTNVVGCIGTAISQGTTVCMLCDTMKGYVLSNGLCLCKEGFVYENSKCIDICGDGKKITSECDDGNTESGDGCSSTCTIEKNFRCSGGTLNASKCAYERLDITLSVSKITKTDFLDQGVFVFSITPALSSFSKLNFTKMLSFNCNQSILINQVAYSSGKMTIKVDYLQNLQGNSAKIILFLDREYFLQNSTSLSFTMTSSTAKLIITNDLGTLMLCKMLLTGVSVLAIVVFAASTFVHKMIGVELVFPLQMVYFVHMVNNNYSQSFGLLKYLGFASWNLQSISQSTANIDSVKQNLVFSSSSQQFSVLVVAGLIVAAMVTFAVSMAVKASTEEQEAKSKVVSTIQKVLLCLYKNLLFPFTVAFLPTFFLMSNTNSLHQHQTFPLFVQALFPLFMTTASLVSFYEWRVLIVSKDISSPFQGLPFCSKKHIPFFLTSVLAAALLLSYSYQQNLSNLPIFAAIIELLLLVWMIIGRPYESMFHNIGVLVNLMPAVLFLTYDILRDYKPILQTEDNETYLVIAIICSASLSSLTSISRTAFEVYLWKKMEERQTQKKTQKHEAKLKKKQQLLDKIQRMKDDCEKDKTKTKQTDMAYLSKFRMENQHSSPFKLKQDATSAISVANMRTRQNQLQLKKKLKNRFGQMNSQLAKRKNKDAFR